MRPEAEVRKSLETHRNILRNAEEEYRRLCRQKDAGFSLVPEWCLDLSASSVDTQRRIVAVLEWVLGKDDCSAWFTP